MAMTFPCRWFSGPEELHLQQPLCPKVVPFVSRYRSFRRTRNKSPKLKRYNALPSLEVHCNNALTDVHRLKPSCSIKICRMKRKTGHNRGTREKYGVNVPTRSGVAILLRNSRSSAMGQSTHLRHGGAAAGQRDSQARQRSS